MFRIEYIMYKVFSTYCFKNGSEGDEDVAIIRGGEGGCLKDKFGIG